MAIPILEHHFEALQRCKYPEIARALKVEQERVIEAVQEIATLEPKPGRRFAPMDTRYVVPDVLVKKVGRRLRHHPQRGRHAAAPDQPLLPERHRAG